MCKLKPLHFLESFPPSRELARARYENNFYKLSQTKEVLLREEAVSQLSWNETDAVQDALTKRKKERRCQQAVHME